MNAGRSDAVGGSDLDVAEGQRYRARHGRIACCIFEKRVLVHLVEGLNKRYTRMMSPWARELPLSWCQGHY